MQTFREEAREIPVLASVDVLVIGAGPAGVGAALAAAENGAETMLVEQSGKIGGMATSGMMSHWSGSSESPMLRRIVDKMRSLRGGHFLLQDGRHTICHDMLKEALFEMMEEAGVKVRLHTMFSLPIMEGKEIKGVIVESKSGREAIFAKRIIDCSGDGDVAARAGAEFQKGREEDGKMQPVTLMFRIGGVDYTRAVFPPSFETHIPLPDGDIQELGHKHLPFPAGHVLLYRTLLPNEVCVNMTNVIDIDGTNADDLSKAEIICHRQIDSIVPFLRKYVPGYENCYVVATAENVGVRETRHIKGLYTMTGEDTTEGRIFDDWIATRNQFNFDIHNIKGPGLDEHGAQVHFRSKGKYTVPLRACIPAGIDSLLVAGRCISGTHLAHSNYRVMAICLNIGHGVGTAAAVSVKKGVQPADLQPADYQERLKQDGVEL